MIANHALRMGAIKQFTFIFPAREDATEEKRVSDARCRPRHFLIPESWAARGKLSTAALNFSRTFLIYTWHQHTAEQSTSLPRSSVGPPLAELLLILAGLSVGRFSRSFRLFALCWIHPACPVHPLLDSDD